MLGKTYEKTEEEEKIVYKPKKSIDEMDGKYLVTFLEQVADDAGKYLASYAKEEKKLGIDTNKPDYSKIAQKAIEESLGIGDSVAEKRRKKQMKFVIKAKDTETRNAVSKTLSSLRGKSYGDGTDVLTVGSMGSVFGGAIPVAVYDVSLGGTTGDAMMLWGAIAATGVGGGCLYYALKNSRKIRKELGLRNLSVEE